MSENQTKTKMPPSVWVLGFVSLLMDVSSEMIHSILPLFMVTALSLGPLTVGLVEGAAESTALIVKIFSGVISDFLGKRKLLAVLGYGLAAVTKPFFALAQVPSVIFGARLLDRVGKGIRGAPRDALIADITPINIRGAAFGIRQALDTAGAFAGPALAALFMWLLADNFRAVFWIAVIPAVMCVSLLIFGVKEPEKQITKSEGNPLSRENLKKMSPAFWGVALAGGVFSLARFSEAFLVLRARDAGLALAAVPLVMVFMNVIYAGAAYPFGKMADKFSRKNMLLAGLAVLFCSNIFLARTNNLWMLLAGIALWGLHLALTQGLMSVMVADASPAGLRGTGFGVFNLISGLALLFASVAAGFFWQKYGAAFTFYFGARMSVYALCVVYFAVKEKKYNKDSEE